MHNKLPIDYALEYGQNHLGYADVCRYLILQGAFLNYGRHSKYLYSAAEKGKLEIIKLLHELKFDLNQVDVLGESPLFKAALNNCVGVFKYLHQNGANLNITNAYGKSIKDIINESNNPLLRQYFAKNYSNHNLKNAAEKSRNDVWNSNKSSFQSAPSISLIKNRINLILEKNNNIDPFQKITGMNKTSEGFEDNQVNQFPRKTSIL